MIWSKTANTMKGDSLGKLLLKARLVEVSFHAIRPTEVPPVLYPRSPIAKAMRLCVLSFAINSPSSSFAFRNHKARLGLKEMRVLEQTHHVWYVAVILLKISFGIILHICIQTTSYSISEDGQGRWAGGIPQQRAKSTCSDRFARRPVV